MFLVCNQQGQAYTDSGFKAMWGRVVSARGEKGNIRFTFHDLRAKTITRMLEDGRQARNLSGHTSDAVVKKVYDRRPIRRSKAVE